MKVGGKVVVITGGGSGLGSSAAQIVRDLGADAVVVVDRDPAHAIERGAVRQLGVGEQRCFVQGRDPG